MIDPVQDPQRPESWSVDASGYDAAFAPLTAAFAADAVRILRISSTDRVLDVAAGSGAFTFAAATTGAEVMATDFAPGMVKVLRDRARTSGTANVTAEVMDGQALTLDDGSFDVVCSMFGLMFFPDLDTGLREKARVVRSGGRLGVGTWASTSYRLPALVATAAQAALPDIEFPNSPPRAPRLATVEAMTETLIDASWSDVAVDTIEHPLVMADPAAFLLAIPEWSAPLRPLFDRVPHDALPVMAEAFAELAFASGQGEGGAHIPWTALIGTGTAP